MDDMSTNESVNNLQIAPYDVTMSPKMKCIDNMWCNPNSQIVMANLTSGKNSQGPFNQSGFVKGPIQACILVKLDKDHLGYFLTSFPCQKDLVFL